MADGTTPLAQAYRAYEQLEGQLSTALDQLVATNGFADLLAMSATNVMALTRLVNGTVDRVVRSTRLAARTDVTDLARQLARTEDKVELLLRAIREVQDRLERADAHEGAVPPAATPAATPATAPTSAPTAASEAVPAANGKVSRARATAARRTVSREQP